MILLLVLPGPWDVYSETSIYEAGKVYAEQGDIQRALDTWAEAKFKLDQPSLLIGFSFLELATKHQLEDRYTQATDLYFWGLTDWNTTRFTERKTQELTYLTAILSKEEKEDLDRLVKDSPALESDWIRQFWIQNDPIATTVENERLLEHWERITYAKTNFTENENTVFGTDERGDYYVRYGEPDQRINGTFEITFNRILFLIRLKLNSNKSIYSTYYGIDVDRYFSAAFEFALLFEQKILQWYGRERSYELWIYDNDEYRKYENALMFGKDFSGTFAHLKSPDDMIHPTLFATGSSFTLQQTTRSSIDLQINPALLLQFHMYERLSQKTFLYKDAFYEIENRYAGERFFTKYDGYTIRDINLSKFKENSSRFEHQLTTTTEDLPPFDFTYNTYRVLRDGKQAVLIAHQLYTGQQIYKDMEYNYPDWFDETKKPLHTNLFEYEVLTALQLFNEENLLRAKQQISLQIDTLLNEYSSQSSVFELPVLDEAATIKLIAQLNNKTEGTRPVTETVLPDFFRAYSEELFEVGPSAPLNATSLELSDILIGFKLDHQTYDSFIPFTVAANNTLSSERNLNLHFEVYHLEENATGLYKFSVEYSLKKKGRILDRILSNRKKNRQVLAYTTDAPDYFANLEIKLDRFKPGDYELELVVTDLTNGETVTRTTNVTAVKDD